MEASSEAWLAEKALGCCVNLIVTALEVRSLQLNFCIADDKIIYVFGFSVYHF